MNNRTRPSGQPGGIPSGSPAEIRDNDYAATRRSLIRENEAAATLARAGYNVEQRPSVPGLRKRPDYKIEGEIFDCYAPAALTPAYNIIDTIAGKVSVRQTKRLILNLDDSNISLEELQQQLASNPIPELLEIILIKNENIINFYP